MSERTSLRRQDRAVTDDAWIRSFLHRAPVGVLATVSEGQPFLHSNLFVYDEPAHALYFHSARTGRTPANLAADPRACFTVMEMGRLLPADVALEFSLEFASVIVFGQVSLVTDPDAATRALQRLLDKYAPHLRPGQDYRPPVEAELRRTAVYSLAIAEWSGKKKEVDADFPGAYWYESEPVLRSLAQRP